MNTLIGALNEFGRWLVNCLWQVSIELAILSLAVVVAILLLRIRSPRIRHLFWCLVLAKPLAVLLLASPVSLYWYLHPAPVVAPAAPHDAGMNVSYDGGMWQHMRGRAMGNYGMMGGVPPYAEVQPAPPVKLTPLGIVAAVWLAGVAALGLRLAVGFAYMVLLRWTASREVPAEIRDALGKAAARLGVKRRVAVGFSDFAGGPVLAGVIRPIILLPRALPARLSPWQLTMVLAHELAHQRRNDNALLVVQRIAEMLLFFHPAVWICGWAIRRESEAACDDAVVNALGMSAAYADSLARVAEAGFQPARAMLLNTFAATESDFGRRAKRILIGKRRRTALALTVASVVALIVLGCVGLPAASERKAKTESKVTVTATETATPEAAAVKAGQPVNEIAPDGMLRNWNVMDFAVNPQGIRNMPPEYFRETFDKDYLAPVGGQATARLARGASVEYLNETGDKTTVQATAMPANSLGWMVSELDEAKLGRRVVYAFCNVKSDRPREATWYFGSGDEANIWVNGRLVHETYVPRPYCEPRQDEFKADLKQGLNTVMVKASQRSMNWEFVLEVHPEGAAPEAKESTMSAPVTSKATVRREGDTVLIEGVQGWGPGDRASSVHAAQAAILAAVGEDVSYTDLVGASALAFRMQVSNVLCPSSPHPWCGEQCITGSNNNIPLQVRVFEVKADDAEGVAAARKAVMESIDRGVPVQYGSEEDGIVVGYQKGGASWLVLHPQRNGGTKVVQYDGWPWGVAVYEGRKMNMPSRHDVAVAAVEKAVMMARTPTAPKGDYFLGFRAWEFWIDKLASLKDDDQKALNEAIQGNSWIYTTLFEYRAVGADYLRSAAGGFKPQAAEHINAAADIYEKMAKEVLTDPDHCALTVAPTAWSLQQGQKWDQAMRDDQLRRMKAAFPMEQQAIAELAEALDAEGVKLTAGEAATSQPDGASATVTPLTSGVAGMVSLSTPTPEELTHGARWQVEGMPLSIALRACMNVLGEDFGKEVSDGWSTDHAYDLCLSATGEAYEMCMQVSRSDGSMVMAYRRRPAAVNAEAYRRAMEALGHEGDVLMRLDGSGGAASFAEADVRGAVVQAIDGGRPAIVQGMPRPGFYAVVTGYANSGGALSGWSCEGGGPSILFERDKRQEFTNWFPVIEGVVIVKGKSGGLDERVHRRILEQAVAFLRRDESNGYLAGQALYDAWARRFEQGPATPDDASAQASYAGWLDPPIWDLAERRHYARVYLNRAAPGLPAVADKLTAAAGEFAAIHDLMWDISRAGGGRQPGAGFPWLRDPGVRKTIAGVIRRAAQHDAKAADYLAEAVRTLGGTPVPAGETVKPTSGAPADTASAPKADESASSRFETRRLVIRRFTADDWQGIQALAIDKESTKYAKYDHPWPLDEKGAKGATNYFARDAGSWAVCLKTDGKLVGYIRLGDIDKDKQLDLGHVFLSTVAEDDYATEALGRMVDHAFGSLAIDGIVCHNPDEYKEQLAPLEKLGMKVKGRGKGSLQKDADGKPIEFVCCDMVISRGEWQNRGATTGRLVIEGVPRIGYNVRLCPFPGSLESVMKFLGDRQDYDYIMAVSGGAFRRFYNRDDGGNVSLEYLAPEVYRRTFEAIGRRCTVLPTGNRGEMIAAIRQSLAGGKPVLASVGGPECGIVAGYDKGGDVLIGWSYFQDSSKGYFELSDWHAKLNGPPYLVLIGDKATKPAERNTLVSTLQWAIGLERTSRRPGFPNHVTGIAAYEAWAEELETDADYPGDKPGVLRTRAMIQVDQVVMLADRGSAAKYLREMKNVAPEAAEPLEAAAALYEEASAGAGKLWRWGDWKDPKAGEALTDPKLRREFAAAVRLAAQKESAAVDQLAKALAVLDPDAARRLAEKLSGAADAPAATAIAPAEEKKLAGLRQRPAWITRMGCIKGCAEYLGSDVSYGWLYGGSGQAFVLNIHCAVCPSGPTAWSEAECDALAANVGLKIEPFQGDKLKDGIDTRREQIWQKTREAIDAGHPAFGWEMDVPEWYVIYGYDSAGDYLFDQFGAPGRKPHATLGKSDIGVACVKVVTLCTPADDRKTVREALVFAVKHGLGAGRQEQYETGLAAYDLWARALRDEKLATEDQTIGFGCAYNAQCWFECRRNAVGFLKQAKDRLGNGKLSPLFDEAIGHYEAVAAELSAVAQAYPFSTAKQDEMAARIKDKTTRLRAAGALEKARDAEKAGLTVLAEIARRLGA